MTSQPPNTSARLVRAAYEDDPDAWRIVSDGIQNPLLELPLRLLSDTA
jgi:hypothetical protein